MNESEITLFTGYGKLLAEIDELLTKKIQENGELTEIIEIKEAMISRMIDISDKKEKVIEKLRAELKENADE